MGELKFKKGVEPMPITDDFWYMLTSGGYCAPEKFLEDEDAKVVRAAINLLKAYEQQGYDEGFFEEI